MEDMRHPQQQVGPAGPNMMSAVAGVVPNHSNNAHRRGKGRVTMHALMSEALPLDEAARLEMKALPSKTPVSVLQELLSRRGTTPKYELVQIEGAVHEPTFRYRVTVADVVGSYTNNSFSRPTIYRWMFLITFFSVFFFCIILFFLSLQI